MNKPKLAALSGELVPAADTPLAEVRIGRLNTARACSTELARLYRASRKGHVDPGVAAKLAYVMAQLINSLKVSDLESRLDRLEDAAQLKRLPGPQSAPADYDAAQASTEAEAADAAIIDAPTE